MGSFLQGVLASIGGKEYLEISRGLLFNKVIGFQGLSRGVGTTSVVCAFAEYISRVSKLRVCILDTEFLFCMLRDMLIGVEDVSEDMTGDILTFSGDIRSIAEKTRIKNVYLVSLRKRGVRDALSVMDTPDLAEYLINELKIAFDIVLVDLNLFNLTALSAFAAQQCNKIFFVGSDDWKARGLHQKSLTILESLGVPYVGAKLIGNRMSHKADAVYKDFDVVGTIPYSVGVSDALSKGMLFDVASKNAAILEFERVCSALYDNVFSKEVDTSSRSDEVVSININNGKKGKKKGKVSEEDVLSNEEIEGVSNIDEGDII